MILLVRRIVERSLHQIAWQELFMNKNVSKWHGSWKRKEGKETEEEWKGSVSHTAEIEGEMTKQEGIRRNTGY